MSGLLTITHSYEDGTLLDGTSKGDGTADIVKANGWRWFPSITMWGIRSSREKPAKRYQIERTADALRAAGFEVAIEIDNTPRAMEDSEADRAARMQARSDALHAKADRLGRESDARCEAADRLGKALNGQPILIGHYSERRTRRAYERIAANMHKSVELYREAKQAEDRADTAADHMAHRENPGRTARRIEKLEADRRRVQRSLDGYTRNHRTHAGEIFHKEVHKPATGDYRQSLEDKAAYLDEQLRYWRKVLDQAKADGRWNSLDVSTIRPGDLVQLGGHQWHKVVRVNKKTLTLATGYSWTDKVPHHSVTAHKAS